MSKAQENFSASIMANLKIAGLLDPATIAKAKALIALAEIAESMKETADGSRAATLKTIADVRTRGNTVLADALQKDLDARPATARGVSAENAIKAIEKLTPLTGITIDNVTKLGTRKAASDAKWQLADSPARDALIAKVKASGTDVEKLTAADLNKRIEAEREKLTK